MRYFDEACPRVNGFGISCNPTIRHIVPRRLVQEDKRIAYKPSASLKGYLPPKVLLTWTRSTGNNMEDSELRGREYGNSLLYEVQKKEGDKES